MDIRNIYVITGKGYTKDMIVDEIQSEGYKHNFFFGSEYGLPSKEYNMNLADEVWVFGRAEETQDYNMAVARHKDIWQMG